MTKKENKKEHFHTLFVDGSLKSKKAEELIRKLLAGKRVFNIAIVRVEQDSEFPVLPHVVSSAGDFRGFDAVKRFAVSPLCT